MTDVPVTLITGTSRGIGLGLAEHCLAQGHVVLGCSRHGVDLQHEHYRHFSLDVTDERAVTGMFSEVRREFGRLDHLIHNAGSAAMNHALTVPMTTVRRLMEVNYLAAFHLCREAAKLMLKRKYGRIVNLVTVAVPLRLEGEAAYVASKAATLSLTQVLAREFAPFGITINAVGPGPVETDLIRGVPEEKIRRLLQMQAIHRMTTPADIARVIDFFLDPACSMVTGQTIYLGGV
ncbi:MAG: SDR family oxidoreductase [Acidobacteriota bacterium]